MATMCKECGLEFNSVRGLARHLGQTHKIKSDAYWDKHIGRTECLICGNETKFEGLATGYVKTCSHKCAGIMHRAAMSADSNKQATFVQKIAVAQAKVWANRTEDHKRTIFDQVSATARITLASLTKPQRSAKYGYWSPNDARLIKAVKKRKEWQLANPDKWKAAHDGRRLRLIATGRILDKTNPVYSSFEEYKLKARRLSWDTYSKHEQVLNPRGLKLGRHDMHLDHKVSLFDCFNANVTIELAASLKNLQLLAAKENLSKHSKSCMPLEELYG